MGKLGRGGRVHRFILWRTFLSANRSRATDFGQWVKSRHDECELVSGLQPLSTGPLEWNNLRSTSQSSTGPFFHPRISCRVLVRNRVTSRVDRSVPKNTPKARVDHGYPVQVGTHGTLQKVLHLKLQLFPMTFSELDFPEGKVYLVPIHSTTGSGFTKLMDKGDSPEPQ